MARLDVVVNVSIWCSIFAACPVEYDPPQGVIACFRWYGQKKPHFMIKF